MNPPNTKPFLPFQASSSSHQDRTSSFLAGNRSYCYSEVCWIHNPDRSGHLGQSMQEPEEEEELGIVKSFSYHIRTLVQRCSTKHLPGAIVRIRDCFHAGDVPVEGCSSASAVAASTCSDD